MTLESLSQAYKDLYPLPGSTLKQYVVDTRRESAWEDATCPRFNVDPHHVDGDDESCHMSGSVSWMQLARSSCDVCEALYLKAASEPSVVAWLAEKAARPPIEPDRTKLSGEVAPEWPTMREHPLLAMVRRK